MAKLQDELDEERLSKGNLHQHIKVLIYVAHSLFKRTCTNIGAWWLGGGVRHLRCGRSLVRLHL